MAFRIRTIDLTAGGREIVREREIAGDALTIGRSAECDIHLPDLAVEQRHARVAADADGGLLLEALGSLGFTLDGRPATRGRLAPGEGAEIVLGSYRLEFSPVDVAADGVFAIAIRKLAETEGGRGEALGGFSLAGVLPGKRPMAWAGLGAILLAFLAVPIFTHLTRERVAPDYDSPGAVKMDAAWSAGALSLAHHGLEDNCEACHAEPFQAVRDETCVTCHQDLADHAAPARLTPARGPMSWGDAAQARVAHAFGKPGPGACTDCHTEHEGAGRMEPTREKFCADCHGAMDARLTDTALGNASDFGKAHPEFRAAVFTAPGQDRLRRVAVGQSTREWNGLRFPHDMHLDARGGVARMAQRLGAVRGYGEALECSDCHRTTADGVRFQPVEMERDCESCHSLVYDQVGSTFRTLRHGDAEHMRADLLAMDRAARRPVVSDRRRPGEYGAGGLYRADFGRPASGAAMLAAAMSRDGLCGECHVPAAGGALAVMPVAQHSRYYLHGWFDHEDHKQEQCVDCHRADTSDSASDLLLPGIAECRTCHEGETARAAEVPSSCAMCHSYHPRTGGAAAPPRVARR